MHKKNLKLNWNQCWKKPRFLEKVFRFFRFQCRNKTGHKLSTQEVHPIHNSLSVRAFSVKHKQAHKSRLKDEIKNDLYKSWPKNKKKNKKPKFWTFEVFKPRFFRSHFPALIEMQNDTKSHPQHVVLLSGSWQHYNNNNNNLICIAPVCAKKTSVAQATNHFTVKHFNKQLQNT